MTSGNIESRKDGQGANLRALFDQYAPALRRHFLKRGAGSDADDLLQEVFIRLQIGAEKTSVENMEGYIFRIANNVLISRYRHQSFRARRNDELERDQQLQSESFSPERILLGQEAWASVVEGIKLLPERSRDAFVMHRFEGMSYAAIAARMGVSISAVEKLISRALEQLAKRRMRQ